MEVSKVKLTLKLPIQDNKNKRKLGFRRKIANVLCMKSYTVPAALLSVVSICFFAPFVKKLWLKNEIKNLN